jgi:8-oxo-dGTP pyrophosphatase MutT (NUDIX family)
VTDPAAELGGWHPPDPRQASLLTEFIEHSTAHAAPASRDCLPDHLTASALVLDPEGTRVLLCLHRKVGLWLQFGGHVEPSDATLADAALREAREESGLATVELHSATPVQLDRHGAPCSAKARHHLDVQFLALAVASSAPVVSEESLDVRWFDVGALPEKTDHAVTELVAAALRRLNGRD